MKVRDGGSIVVLVILAVIFIGAIFTHEKAKSTAEESGETAIQNRGQTTFSGPRLVGNGGLTPVWVGPDAADPPDQRELDAVRAHAEVKAEHVELEAGRETRGDAEEARERELKSAAARR